MNTSLVEILCFAEDLARKVTISDDWLPGNNPRHHLTHIYLARVPEPERKCLNKIGFMKDRETRRGDQYKKKVERGVKIMYIFLGHMKLPCELSFGTTINHSTKKAGK